MAVEYKDLLAAVSRKTGLSSGEARAAAEATVTALARALAEPARSRFLRTLPPELYDDYALTGGPQQWDEASFVQEVAMLGRRPAEQARVRAQAVLASVAEQEPGLLPGLPVPDGIRPLLGAPSPGGGIVSGPTEHEAPLTADEIENALSRLPDWSGDASGLRRTIVLPPENLRAVLDRIGAVKAELGRAPTVHGYRDDTAELVVRTASVGAVTALDVELAARLDDLIADAAAGIG